jgi:hypothetical protein
MCFVFPVDEKDNKEEYGLGSGNAEHLQFICDGGC